MAMFSALGRAIRLLLMTSLRLIQNLSRFGRLGVGNVSHVTMFEQRNSVTLDLRKVMFNYVRDPNHGRLGNPVIGGVDMLATSTTST